MYSTVFRFFFHSIVATLLNSIKYRDGKTARVYHFVQVLSLPKILKIQMQMTNGQKCHCYEMMYKFSTKLKCYNVTAQVLVVG